MVANASYLGWTAHRRSQARRELESTIVAAHQRSGSGRLSCRRVPQGILAASRIFAFRLRILYVDMMLVEVVFAVFWMGGCLAYIFVPSAYCHPGSEYGVEAECLGI